MSELSLWYARWKIYHAWVLSMNKHDSRTRYEIMAIFERHCVTAACYQGENWICEEDTSKMKSEIQACKHIPFPQKEAVLSEIIDTLRAMCKVDGETPSIVWKELRCGDFKPTLSRENIEMLSKYDPADAMCMLLRYECLMPQGQQWAVPKKWLRSLQDSVGLDLVAFASPLNKGADVPYCSAFESDKLFGSSGSFLRLQPTFIEQYVGGRCVMEINPPFVEQILLDAVRAIEMFARHIYDNKLDVKFTAIFICPDWQDAEYFKRVQDIHTGVIVTKRRLQAGEYTYENGTTGNVLTTRQSSWVFTITTHANELTLDGFTAKPAVSHSSGHSRRNRFKK
jgi:Phosphorylated CTD interacting factor 1 WW domain